MNDDLKDTYNKIAEDWIPDHDKDTWWQAGTDTFLSFVPKGAEVLDIGCGGGQKTNYISEKGYVAIGVDFSEKMIELCKAKYPAIQFEVFDLYNFSSYNKTFDALFAQAVLLHIPKERIMEVLKNLVSKLNPGGHIYIAVKEFNQARGEEEIVKEDDYGYEYERFFSYFTGEELRSYFKELELKVVWEGSIHSGRTNWIQIIGKKHN